MITLDNVTKIYSPSQEQQVMAVRDVSLAVARGEFLIVTGRSGSGKTTLLNLAAGLTPPTAGHVAWQEADLWRLTDRQRSHLRHERLGFVFQFPSLLPGLTVLENVILPTVLRRGRPAARPHEQARELLHTVGLDDKLNAYPRQLSAGQQQRVVVARALVNQPEVLLADEPTSNLDERTEREIMDLFQAIHAGTGVTIVLVTHTRQLVCYGSRHLRMAAGRIIAAEPAEEEIGA